MPFKYPSDLIDPLFEAWNEWLPREGELPTLPPREDVLRILEVAYHASFTVNEQRGNRFTLVVTDPDDRYVTRDPLPVEPPRPLTPHEILRLAPAAGGEMLGLSPSDFSIWGLCSSAWSRLEVSASGPGQLQVGRNKRTIVGLEAGRTMVEASSEAFQVAATALTEASEALWEGIEWQESNWAAPFIVHPRFLFELLGDVGRYAHGGSVFVIPERDAAGAAWRSLLRIKYQCDDVSVWPELRKSMVSYNAKVKDDREVEAAHRAKASARTLLARIARLTQVDGALVITDRFRVLGFGAEVVAPATVDQVLMPDGSALGIEAFGTMQRSAFRFCASYPEAIAFVSSQDIGLRCIVAEGEHVRVWED
jgi:hypothetical protein